MIMVQKRKYYTINEPKELLVYINENLKPKDIEKKLYGEVFTPLHLVNEMLAFFDYFQDKYGWEGMVSGWAIDIIYASVSIGKGKIVLRDSKHVLTHPVGSSYTHEKAGSETSLVFKAFTEFSSIYDEIINKIHLRFNRDPQYMNLLSFYSNEFDLELA